MDDSFTGATSDLDTPMGQFSGGNVHYLALDMLEKAFVRHGQTVVKHILPDAIINTLYPTVVM